MKICVLVPGEEALAQAGVRIRYGRIQPVLRELGHDLDIRPIDSFATRDDFTHDAYIVSKIYDARSLVAAHLLTQSGIPVGADLFDDYFSQTADTRLVRFQQWLEAFARTACFFLCSTPAMRNVSERYAPGIPAHVMNDPSPPHSAAGIEAAAARKLATARATGLLRVGWFGIGDNPYFPVGLHDLAHFGEALAGLRGHGFDVVLNVLTNRRSLTPSGLGMLARLPIPFEVSEWSEAAEDQILAESLLCFLPVSAQPFSTAKSLNRAISCLTSGAQILSVGYPLYSPLQDFIYRDAERFMTDLESGRLAVRAETIPALMDVLQRWADPQAEAAGLIAFLESNRARATQPPAQEMPVIVVHGQDAQRDAHRFSQSLGALSVASPFCGLKLNYDLRFEFTPDAPGMAATITNRLAQGLSAEKQSALLPPGADDASYRAIDLARLLSRETLRASLLGQPETKAATSAVYGDVMTLVTETLGVLFPGAPVCFSELSRLPWRAPSPRAAAS